MDAQPPQEPKLDEPAKRVASSEVSFVSQYASGNNARTEHFAMASDDEDVEAGDGGSEDTEVSQPRSITASSLPHLKTCMR